MANRTVDLATVAGPPEVRVHNFSLQNRTTTFHAFLDVTGPDDILNAAWDGIKQCALIAASGAVIGAIFSSGSAALPAFLASFQPCIASKGIELAADAFQIRVETEHGPWRNVL